MLYAGFLWMTSSGDETKVTKAKGLMVNAVIGLAIVLAAYAITYFVLLYLHTATGGVGGSGGSGTGSKPL